MEDEDEDADADVEDGEVVDKVADAEDEDVENKTYSLFNLFFSHSLQYQSSSGR